MNGGELLAMRKVRDNQYMVLVKNRLNDRDEFVTAWAEHFTSPTWYLGHYHNDLDTASHDFAVRSYLV